MAKRKEKTIIKIDQTAPAMGILNNIYFFDLLSHKKIEYDTSKVMLIVQNKTLEIGLCFDIDSNKIEFNLYHKKGEPTKALLSFEQIAHLIKSSELKVD